MKLKKIYLLLLATTMFAACSDDSESWNNGNATVSMGQQELSFKENKGLVNIPVVVEGTQNGAIRITVEVAETGDNPAMDDIHYIVTSKTVVIPADATIGNIEISTVDDTEINEERTFTMTITKVEGATIGSNNSTLISLRDNDAAFYEKLQGKWKFVGIDAFENEETVFDVNIIGYDEEEDGYDEILYVTGIMGYSWTQMELHYSYDMPTNTITLSIPMGTMFASNVSGFSGGNKDVITATLSGGLTLQGEILGGVNDDFTLITFENKPLYGALFEAGTAQYSGSVWFGFYQIKFTK